MSTKGMSNTAARRLVDELSLMGVTIYVQHDFDKSGFSILHTLRTDTRRYRFKSTPSEPVNCRQKVDPRVDLARCGATPDEQTFLFTGERRRNAQTGKYYWPGQRVELNAITSGVCGRKLRTAAAAASDDYLDLREGRGETTSQPYSPQVSIVLYFIRLVR